MNKINAIIILLVSMLVGCGGGNGVQSDADYDINNVISMSYNQALKKEAVVCNEEIVVADFNLGCFFKSGNYYFILNNNSNQELKDIQITSSNPAFEVSPSNIASMGTPTKQTGATPIIRIGVNHRSPLSTEAETRALPRGAVVDTITITGTINGEQFTTSYTVGGTAKTIEYKISDNTVTIDGPMYVNGKYNDNGIITLGSEDHVNIGSSTYFSIYDSYFTSKNIEFVSVENVKNKNTGYGVISISLNSTTQL